MYGVVELLIIPTKKAIKRPNEWQPLPPDHRTKNLNL
jgi:hypothetical protein